MSVVDNGNDCWEKSTITSVIPNYIMVISCKVAPTYVTAILDREGNSTNTVLKPNPKKY